MIIITGAAGFIGSCLVQKLNAEGYKNLLLVDDFSRENQNKNLIDKLYNKQIDRAVFLEWFKNNPNNIDFVYHIGARTDTTEFNYNILNHLNLNYTKTIWQICSANNIPLVYASSAATYGLGENGYKDDESKLHLLKPLNPYGESKNDFDIWAISQATAPPFWAGLKFFNVYGPNEYHKGRMASVIFHTYNQIKKTGGMNLFQSHHADVKDGEQQRDFVYVKDVTDVLYFFMFYKQQPGIYNLGSGKARTFLDLATNTFNALHKEVSINFIPTPIDIRDKYQYFTEADMNKLKSIGYTKPFYNLEEGIADYVKKYLQTDAYL